MHITRGQLALEEFARSHHFAQPAIGFTKDDALKEESWLHVATQFKAKDVIAILPEDMSWYGEFLVVKASEAGVMLVALTYKDMGASVDIEENPDEIPKGYKVTFGGRQKWRVQRAADGHVLKDGMLKLEAIAWAQSDAKTQAQAA